MSLLSCKKNMVAVQVTREKHPSLNFAKLLRIAQIYTGSCQMYIIANCRTSKSKPDRKRIEKGGGGGGEIHMIWNRIQAE